MKIVYDVDDTLWGLNRVVYPMIAPGLTEKDAITFNCTKNPHLTKEQQQRALKLYSDPEIVKLCKFFDGIERVFDLEVSGKAEVWISSSNSGEDTKQMKEGRLLREIPNVNPEHLRLTTGFDHTREPGDILVDDRADNVINSDFKYYVLINQPHNRNVVFPENKSVVRVDTLIEAIDVVERIVKSGEESHIF